MKPTVGCYNRTDRCGAIYWRAWSLHWTLYGPVVYEDGEVKTLRERPRRVVVLYGRHVYEVFRLRLWRHRGYCEHGFRRTAPWHRCDYVTSSNPLGRPSDDELWPEETFA